MSTQQNIKDIPTDYLPIVYSIPPSTKDIFEYNINPTFSKNIDYPKFSLGFQHFIHQSKTKMEITKDFEGKKKIYYIINQFERYVDDYDTDINSISKAYFDLDPKPNILSRGFFKLWELLFMFDLIDLNKDGFVSAHLAEGPGSFIQATMFYRDKFSKKGLSKNDKYYAVALHADDLKKHIPKLEESFVDYYKKEKPNRFMMHRTYPTEESRISELKDNGDLTSKKTRKLFGGNFSKQKADFITADGGFDWDNENIQEQEAYALIIAQIVTALKIQAKKGSFVCKIYESFAGVTSKLIIMLTSFYENVYVCKPLMSRASNSEKYIVCIDFKDDKNKDKKINELEKLMDQMNAHKNQNLVGIFPDYELNDKYKSTLIKSNVEIANKQFININEMVMFIKNQNYRGDEYVNRRQLQIDATKYWLDTYFPDTNNFGASKKHIMEFANEVIGKNIKEIEAIQKKLDF